MTAATADIQAQEWARSLEDRESARSALPVSAARKAVARRIGVAPGTLENLRRGRIKGVRLALYEGLRAAFCRELEKEIGFLNHELAMARAGSLGSACSEIQEMGAQIERLRALASEGDRHRS